MEIKGLKFTHKSIRLMGGERSGHHGHAGRPGSVGGSTPSSGVILATLEKRPEWKKLSSSKKKDLESVSSQIPDSHTVGVQYLGFDDYRCDREEAGALWLSSGEIYLHTRFATGFNLAHEFGHNVHAKLVKGNDRKVVVEAWKQTQGLSKTKQKGLGYDDYSVSNHKDFFADTYSHWVTKSRQVSVIREKYPELGQVMDTLFGGG